jgi:hypothetical protein
MKPNLWLYSSWEEMNKAAASLITFGADVFQRAKLIRDMEFLKSIRLELDKENTTPPTLTKEIMEFSFEYLIDCVRILIFFENYMKAELIVKGFTVHLIKKEDLDFKSLAKEQFWKPIKVKEIAAIKDFEIDQAEKKITHTSLKNTTLGYNVLTGSIEYLKHYQLTDSMVSFLKKINAYRNKLHLHDNVEFSLSEEFIDNIEELKRFVSLTAGRVG